MKKLASLGQVTAGTALAAAAFGLFIVPQGFVAGGITGFGLLLSRFTPLSLAGAVLALNAVLLLLAFACVGRGFFVKTIYGSLLFPVLLDLFGYVTCFEEFAGDPLFSAVLAGLLLGFGGGLVLRGDGSTGGVDIITVILNRKCGLPVSPVMLACNFVAILLQAVSTPLMKIAYGLLVAFIASQLVGYVLSFGQKAFQVYVFSERYEEILDRLLRQANVGATLLDGESGFGRKTTKVVLSVVHFGKLNEVKSTVAGVDPDAFVVVNQTHAVLGRGYTLER